MERITVGGRTFVSASGITFEQHIWLMAHVRAAGLHQLTMLTDEQRLLVADQVLQTLLESGRTLKILAGSVVEEKAGGAVEPWTEAGALERERFFAGLRDERDFTTITAAIVGVLFSFFLRSDRSSETTRRSTSGTTTGEAAAAASAAGAIAEALI